MVRPKARNVTTSERREQELRVQLSKSFPELGASSGPRVEADPWEWSEGFGEYGDQVRLSRNRQRPELFDYQDELVSNILELIEGAGTGLISLPTGAGKTRTAVVAILEAMAKGVARRAIWLAPSQELVDQAFLTCADLWQGHGAAPDLVLSRGKAPPQDAVAIWVTTPQAIYAGGTRHGGLPWDLTVFDEAHQLGAPTFRQAVSQIAGKGASESEPSLLGLSATPGRVDPRETEDLVSLFRGRLLVSGRLKPNPVRVLQRRGILARVKPRRLTRNILDLGDESGRLVVAARACERLATLGRRILVFTQSVAGARVLAEVLSSRGVGAAAMDAGLNRRERQGRLKLFERGDVRVVTNQRLLAAGYDLPSITDVVITGRVGSPILFEQIVGRAARGPRVGGASVATVWDFDDHFAIHGLPQSYYRYREYDWG